MGFFQRHLTEHWSDWSDWSPGTSYLINFNFNVFLATWGQQSELQRYTLSNNIDKKLLKWHPARENMDGGPASQQQGPGFDSMSRHWVFHCEFASFPHVCVSFKRSLVSPTTKTWVSWATLAAWRVTAAQDKPSLYKDKISCCWDQHLLQLQLLKEVESAFIHNTRCFRSLWR